MFISHHELHQHLVKHCTRIALVLLIIITALTGNLHGQPKNSGVGSYVPDIVLRDTSGAVHRLSTLVGKVVLIDFWASWCGPCRQSNPALVKIYDEYQSKDFEIYGISLDESALAWKNAIKNDKIKWLQVNDDGKANEEGTAAWQIRYIPTSFLLDRKGKIVALNPTVRQIRSYLKKHLK
jgi:thiol-disulfide isomerase/thioredoxin